MTNIRKVYDAVFIVPYDLYMATLQQGIIVHGARLISGKRFQLKQLIEVNTREAAIKSALNWYWYTVASAWGCPSDILTVSDPYLEVMYTDDFNITSRKNNYLDDKTIQRVIDSSNGVLEISNKPSEPNHPKHSLMRTKRRRVYLERVADSVYRHPNTGVMYYRTSVTPQISKGGKQGKPGVIVQKRKVENIRLKAKRLETALKEIERLSL